jgi:hypothetical protein
VSRADQELNVKFLYSLLLLSFYADTLFEPMGANVTIDLFALRNKAPSRLKLLLKVLNGY